MITPAELKNLRNEVKNGLRRAEFARKMLEDQQIDSLLALIKNKGDTSD